MTGQIMIIKNTSFKVGQTLTIGGVPKPNPVRFAVNIGPNEKDIALHVNPRFNYSQDENVVVCNSLQGGYWGVEQHVGNFPFCSGEKFKMTIKFNPTEFLVTLPDGKEICFPNRIGAEEYSVISADDDVCITCVKIE